jgi:hypothetical protein
MSVLSLPVVDPEFDRVLLKDPEPNPSTTSRQKVAEADVGEFSCLRRICRDLLEARGIAEAGE